MQKYIVSNRTDANCARFYGIMCAFYLANRLGVDFKFGWEQQVFGGFDSKTPMNDNIYKKFENQRIIGAKVDSSESIFDNVFLKNHFIDIKAQDEDEVWNHLKYPIPIKNFADFKIFFETTDFTYYDISHSGFFWFDEQEYKACFRNFFNIIKFAPNINMLIQKAKAISTKFQQGFVAVHIRTGDCIYGYSQWSQVISVMNQGMAIHYAMELIEELAKKQNIIVFSDDPDSVNLMLDRLQLNNVFSADKFRDFDKYSVSELLLFDLALMSSANQIYGTISNVSWVASLISTGEYNINVYNLITSKEQYQNIKEKVQKFEFNPYQQSFSYAHLFLFAEKLKRDIQEQRFFLEKAMECNQQNFRYKMYFSYYLAKYAKTQELEQYLNSIDFALFVQLLSLNFDKIDQGQILFLPYFYLADKKYPHIHQIFVTLQEIDKRKGCIWTQKIQKKAVRYFFRKMCCRITFLKKYIIHL